MTAIGSGLPVRVTKVVLGASRDEGLDVAVTEAALTVDTKVEEVAPVRLRLDRTTGEEATITIVNTALNINVTRILRRRRLF